jgi:hypothetical protein
MTVRCAASACTGNADGSSICVFSQCRSALPAFEVAIHLDALFDPIYRHEYMVKTGH